MNDLAWPIDRPQWPLPGARRNRTQAACDSPGYRVGGPLELISSTRRGNSQVGVWADIRSTADFDQVQSEDEVVMHSGVGCFLAGHFG